MTFGPPLTRVTIAQVISDGTLPQPSLANVNCSRCDITGGTVRGNNLFHSFKEFSIPTNGDANFVHGVSIQNIFTRVTGQNDSMINGTLRTSISESDRGDANLFLINPNGIVFGDNASLDIGGSFLATTAERIVFSDNLQFSAIEPQTSLSLLSVNVPIGLQFGRRSGAIVNTSQEGIDDRINSLGKPVGLEVLPTHSLIFAGRGIVSDGGNLTARSGHIELGSIGASSLVSLVPVRNFYQLAYSDDVTFRGLQVANQSIIDTSGYEAGTSQYRQGGSLQIRGQNISVFNSASIVSTTYAGSGNPIDIQAERSLRLNNDVRIETSIREAGGQAGDIHISAGETLRLLANDNALIVNNQNPSDPTLIPSRIRSRVVNSGGTAGNLEIFTPRLIIKDGSRISTPTATNGIGGEIIIRAEDILIDGFNRAEIAVNSEDRLIGRIESEEGSLGRGTLSSGIIAQIADPPDGASTHSVEADHESNAANGSSGSILINANRLTLRNGGFISAATFSDGDAGNLSINAKASIRLQGGSIQISRNQFRSGIFVSSEPDANGDLEPRGNVGELAITTNRLLVDDRAEISANNRGTGDPGRATINAQLLVVRNGGEIRAGSIIRDADARDNLVDLGDGGTLTINADRILLSGRGRIGNEVVPSAIAALSESSGNAGNLNITANELRIEDGARLSVSGAIVSEALPNPGSAGELRLQVGSIFLDQGRIDAETSAGDGANIAIEGLNFLIAQDNSRISAQAFDVADGGNIAIDSRNGFVVAANNSNSDVVANAFAGQGGQIRIRAQSIIGLEPRGSQPDPNGTNDIDASSEFGAPGVISLETPDVEPERGTFELANTLIDTPPLDAVCGSRSDGQSRFALVGRGGLPTVPTDVSIGLPSSVSWVTRESNTVASPVGALPVVNGGIEDLSDRPPQHTSERTIIEAQQWRITENGRVELLSTHSSGQPLKQSTTLSPSCLSRR